MMHKAIDGLATRTGLMLAFAFISAFAALAALNFERAANRLTASQLELELQTGTRAISSLNELLRLRSSLSSLQLGRTLPEEQVAEATRVLDMIYVRADHVEGRLNQLQEGGQLTARTTTAGRAAIAALRDVVVAGDAVLTDGTLARPLDATLADARRAIIEYDELLSGLATQLREDQSRALDRLTLAFQLFNGAITLASLAALYFFRREVLTRQARERAERRADFLAYNDPLTGVPNRVRFHDAVEAHLNRQGRIALLLIDVDTFKSINDKLGHAMGDAVLRETAGRLRQATVTQGGMAARLGGDEFAVFLPFDDRDRVSGVMARILEACRRPVTLDGDSVSPTVSVGGAIGRHLGRLGAPTLDKLTQAADFALYVAKDAGRDCSRLFDRHLEEQFSVRRAMVRDLPAALKQGAIEVYLQPKVTLRDGVTYGFEALARWRRDGQIVPPDEFIHVAEESGLILDLDRYMIERSITLLTAHNADADDPVSVSVNISAKHLLQDGLEAALKDILSRHAFPAERLTLEITESVELDNWATVRRAVTEIRRMGIRISIDDFGTGYSSLAYLRMVSADELKIDKSLIREIDTSTEARFILDSVLDLAHSLNLDVVVEGVERPSQVYALQDFGVVYAQGYLYGKPHPAEEALQRLRANRVPPTSADQKSSQRPYFG